MFHTCNTSVYPTHVLHVYNYMCNTGVYPTPVLHVQKYMCNTGIYPTHVLHVQNMCITHVYATHVIYLYLYTCNTLKITTHVLQMQYNWSCEELFKEVRSYTTNCIVASIKIDDTVHARVVAYYSVNKYDSLYNSSPSGPDRLQSIDDQVPAICKMINTPSGHFQICQLQPIFLWRQCNRKSLHGDTFHYQFLKTGNLLTLTYLVTKHTSILKQSERLQSRQQDGCLCKNDICFSCLLVFMYLII